MSNKDVTNQISFGESDGESLSITKCVCGEKFEIWDFSISIYDDLPTSCPKCGREFFWRQLVTVFEVVSDSEKIKL